jgi:ferritin-like metal-binding protein YciE
MKIETLENLLADELKAIYSAQNQIIRSLPALAKAARSNDLRLALEEYLERTRAHSRHLEQICEDLHITPKGRKALGMEGIIEEGKEVLQDGVEPEPMAAALIGTVQRAEHYEIAAYGTARAHARQLGFLKVAEALGRILGEEKQADRQLTVLAENRVNVQAAMSKAHAN